jgi:putative transport protein
VISLLASNPILLLFLICGVGFTAGRISINGFSFGVAAVLFVGIGAGAVSASWILPDDVWTFGLAIFVYTTGLACGPSFLRTVRRRGLPLNTTGIGVVVLGAVVAAVMAALAGLSSATGAGVFAGAATTSPGLAAIVGYMEAHSPADVFAKLGAEPVIGYSLTYPLGVLVPLLICSALLRHDPAKRRRLVERTARVEDVDGLTLRELAEHLNHRVAFGRVYHKGKLIAADPEYEIHKGDRITLNGKREDVSAALEVVGEMIDDKTVAFDHSRVDSRRVVVSDHSLAGARLGDVDLSGYHAVVTRVRRGDTDMVAHPDLMLELGDHVRLIAPRKKLRKASRVFGDSYRSLNELDVLPFAFGIAAGMLLGLIPFPLPGGGTLTLGFAGGPLIVGLVLGALGHTGRMCWQLPAPANQTVRQLGVALLLAGIGTKAGQSFAHTVTSPVAIRVILAGAVVTLASNLIVLGVASRLMRLSPAQTCGVIAGVSTQPAVFAYASQNTSDENSVLRGYSTVFPVVMVSKIVTAALLITLLLR